MLDFLNCAQSQQTCFFVILLICKLFSPWITSNTNSILSKHYVLFQFNYESFFI